MIGRALALAIGLFAGLAASQLPEFAQQYRQRLGGAVDELRRVVARLDDVAGASGQTRDGMMRHLSESPDPIVRGHGEADAAVVARLGRLEEQQRAFATAGPFDRLLVLVRDPDPALARAAYRDFEPAWPATSEGLVSGGTGFALGWLGVMLAARSGRRLFGSRRGSARLRTA